MRIAVVLVWVAGIAGTPVAALASRRVEPRSLYDEAKIAYDKGDYALAVKKLDTAYAVQGDPMFLYSTAFVYRHWYAESRAVGHLRAARHALATYLEQAADNPALQETVDEVRALIPTIDVQLATAESARISSRNGPSASPARANPDGARRVPAATVVHEADTAARAKHVGAAPDHGKPLRLSGTVLMATGGGGLLAAAGLFGHFAIQGASFGDKLRGSMREREALACAETPSVACQQADADLASHRDNGHRANRGAIVSAAVGGSVGVIALLSGALLFVQGTRRTPVVRRHLSGVRFGPALRGVGLWGRF